MFMHSLGGKGRGCPLCGRRAPEMACDALDEIIASIISFNAADMLVLTSALTQTDAESKLFSNRDFELSNLKIVAKLLNKKFNNDVIENVLWMCVNRELSAREIAHISYERIKSLDKVQLKLV